MSAAVAAPRLIRKLQCIVATCASPLTSPRQPAASISCQALSPGGFLNVEPPVFSRIGCEASRAWVIRSISARIAAGSPGRPKTPRGEDDVLRRQALAIGKTHVRVANTRASFAGARRRRALRSARPWSRRHARRRSCASAPPIEPGNAAKERETVEPGLCGGLARRTDREPRRRDEAAVVQDLDFAEARRTRRMTTPSTPPSRTMRLEPSPIVVTGISRGRFFRK